jgi:hypothetical protein
MSRYYRHHYHHHVPQYDYDYEYEERPKRRYKETKKEFKREEYKKEKEEPREKSWRQKMVEIMDLHFSSSPPNYPYRMLWSVFKNTSVWDGHSGYSPEIKELIDSLAIPGPKATQE